MLKKIFFASVLLMNSVLICNVQAEEIYVQNGDTALAFELDSIVLDHPPNKSKFQITATRKIVGQVQTKQYTGNFDEDNVTQYHIKFDCKNQTIQFLDIIIGDKNNGELKYKNDKKGQVIHANSEQDLEMLNLVCSNVIAVN